MFELFDTVIDYKLPYLRFLLHKDHFECRLFFVVLPLNFEEPKQLRMGRLRSSGMSWAD